MRQKLTIDIRQLCGTPNTYLNVLDSAEYGTGVWAYDALKIETIVAVLRNEAGTICFIMFNNVTDLESYLLANPSFKVVWSLKYKQED